MPRIGQRIVADKCLLADWRARWKSVWGRGRPIRNDEASTMRVSQILDKIDENQELGKTTFGRSQENSDFRCFLLIAANTRKREAAFHRGLTTRNNPYPFGSPAHWRWHEGLFGNGHPRAFMTTFLREFKPLPIVEGTMQGNPHMAETA